MCKETEAKLYAEGIATFALTFVGAGAIWVSGGDLLTVAVAHGMILSVMVTATMNISGGHINPAITIGFMATKRIDSKLGAQYIAAQLVGALLAAGPIDATISKYFGLAAVALAAVNIFGGFVVTNRMLSMFKKKS